MPIATAASVNRIRRSVSSRWAFCSVNSMDMDACPSFTIILVFISSSSGIVFGFFSFVLVSGGLSLKSPDVSLTTNHGKSLIKSHEMGFTSTNNKAPNIPIGVRANINAITRAMISKVARSKMPRFGLDVSSRHVSLLLRTIKSIAKWHNDISRNNKMYCIYW
jgi:hypothetical protein